MSADLHSTSLLSEPPSEECAQTTEADCPVPLAWKSVLSAVRESIRTTTLERDAATIGIRSFGDGPPLYFLNNVWGDWELFALSMWLLRDEYRCVVVDWPESTGRRLPTRRLSAENVASDLVATADELGDDRFAVFATSFGCLPAVWAATTSQERISSLVLHAGFARYRLGLFERLLLRVGRLMQRPLARLPLFERIQTENHRSWFPPFDSSRWAFLLENIGRTPTSTAMQRIAALKSCDLRGQLGTINGPTALVLGEGADGRIRRREHELADELPHAARENLPYAGHFPFVTHPHVLTRFLKKFLAEANDVDEPEGTEETAMTSPTTAH